MNITEPASRPTHAINRVISSIALLVVIYVSVFSWQSWHEEKAVQINNLMNIMELEQKAIDTYFTQIENSIHVLIHEINETDDEIDISHAFNLVKKFKESHPELFNVTFIRNDGQILFTATAPPDPTLPTLAHEPSFQIFLRELQTGKPISIGKPLVSLISKEWIIPLRYVVNNKAGTSSCIISANLPVKILLNYWKDAPFAKKSALGLMRDDGFLISRYPVPEKLEMEKIYGRPRTGALISYLKQQNFPINGYVEGPSSLDGPDHLNAFNRLEHFPITLFIAMPMSEIRIEWWNKVKAPYIITAILMIGCLIIYRLTYLRERNREIDRFHASEVIRESENRFRTLFEHNKAIMLMIDPDTGNIVQANKAAENFYGWTIEELINMRIQEINQLTQEEVMKEIKNALSFGSIHLSFQHRRADNSIRDVDAFSCKIQIKDKTFLYSIIFDITDRKIAEEKLLASEKRFRSIINASPVPMLIYNVQQNITFLNPSFLHTFGYALEDIPTLDQWSSQAYPDPEYRQWVTDNWISKLKQTKKTAAAFLPMEVVIRCKNGENKTVLASFTLLPETSEDTHLVVLLDITEQKQANEIINELNRDFISFLENSSDFIFFKDENGRYRFCSQALADITGHGSWRDMIGKKSSEVFPDELFQRYNETELQVYNEGKSILNRINPYYDILGNKKWFTTNKWPLFNRERKVVGLLGISRDITELLQIQEDLRISEERLSLAMKATQDAIWDWDLLNDTMHYSPRWWQLIGYNENELKPEVDLWKQVIHPEDLDRAVQIVENALVKETTFTVECRLLHKDGHYVPILTRGYILRDNDGKTIRVSGTNTDLSEQKKIEAERSMWEQQRLQLEKAESLNCMAGAIAHHFNNHLYVVIGNIELAMDDLPAGSNEAEMLNSAMKASQKAADVSRLMLTYLGQTPGKQELLNLSETCRSALEILQAVIPKNVLLEPLFSTPGPTVRANTSQIHQVFTNLITNAWESISENKGTITLG